MNSASHADPIAALRTTGKFLPPARRSAVLALGRTAIPPLLAILDDDALAAEDAPGDGWPPIHAGDLLIELKAEEAIPSFLRILGEFDWESILYNRVAVGLPALGAPVLEPAMQMLESTQDPDVFNSLCHVVAALRVKDERIFDAICDLFEEEPLAAALCFADYGDARALPLLRSAIEDFAPQWGTWLPVRDLVDFVDAYETLAGSLPADLADHVQRLRDEAKRSGNALLSVPARAMKIGRNDPCPCASGKKYKKCCFGKASSPG